jgi:hypothetical protein
MLNGKEKFVCYLNVLFWHFFLERLKKTTNIIIHVSWFLLRGLKPATSLCELGMLTSRHYVPYHLYYGFKRASCTDTSYLLTVTSAYRLIKILLTFFDLVSIKLYMYIYFRSVC